MGHGTLGLQIVCKRNVKAFSSREPYRRLETRPGVYRQRRTRKFFFVRAYPTPPPCLISLCVAHTAISVRFAGAKYYEETSGAAWKCYQEIVRTFCNEWVPWVNR